MMIDACRELPPSGLPSIRSRVDPYFAFLATSSDGTYTCAGQLFGFAEDHSLRCLVFERERLIEEHRLPWTCVPVFADWSGDNECLSLAVGPRLFLWQKQTRSMTYVEVESDITAVFFTAAGTVGALVGDALTFFNRRLHKIKVIASVVALDALMGRYAYCDRDGRIVCSWQDEVSGSSPFEWKDFRCDLTVTSTHAYAVMKRETADGQSQAVRVVPFGSGLRETRVNVRNGAGQITGMKGGALCVLRRRGQTTDVGWLEAESGTEHLVAAIPCSRAEFVKGVLGDRCLFIAQGKRKTVFRVTPEALIRVAAVNGDVGRIQTDGRVVHACVIADSKSDGWYLQLQRRRVLCEENLSAPRKARAHQPVEKQGVIYIPNPFDACSYWAQRTLFQHVLLSTAKTIADRRMPIVTVRLDAYQRLTVVEIRSGFKTKFTEALRRFAEMGRPDVVVVAGSMAAYILLKEWEQLNRCRTALLVSPVYFVDHRIAKKVGVEREDNWEEGTLEDTIRSLRRRITARLCIVHGSRDEVAPAKWSSLLMSNAYRGAEACYCCIPNEGHIFRDPANWSLAMHTMCSFAMGEE